jgi:Excalibur calcium-binding domain
MRLPLLIKRLRFWKPAPGPWDLENPEEKRRRAENIFRKITRQRNRRTKIRTAIRVIATVSAVGAAFGLLVGVVTWKSPWPFMQTVKHYAAYWDCNSARAVGVAPARVGQPGYWPHLDRDKDGIACEDFTPNRSTIRVLRPPIP